MGPRRRSVLVSGAQAGVVLDRARHRARHLLGVRGLGHRAQEVLRVRPLGLYDDPCGPDCPGIDYLPIDGGQPFDLYIVGFEWYIHPSVRFSPNVELVKYDDPPGLLVKPEDDQVLRLTFFWTW